jgi:hypothetical protein
MAQKSSLQRKFPFAVADRSGILSFTWFGCRSRTLVPLVLQLGGARTVRVTEATPIEEDG